MKAENYNHMRHNVLDLSEWDSEKQTHVDKEPTNLELLKLLDALVADLEGYETKELQEAKGYYYR